jgi:phosphatidylserine/phosphatidylglycerophosphate/cardiolipin synthase-like enzyme
MTDPPETKLYIASELQDALPLLLGALRIKLSIQAYELNPTLSPSQFGHRPLMPQLLSLPKRGVHCRIILASSNRTANVRIGNTAAAVQLARAGWQARIAPPHPLQHAKYWLLDDQTAILGSHNLTIAALTSNIEVSIATNAPKLVTRLAELFGAQWERSAPP